MRRYCGQWLHNKAFGRYKYSCGTRNNENRIHCLSNIDVAVWIYIPLPLQIHGYTYNTIQQCKSFIGNHFMYTFAIRIKLTLIWLLPHMAGRIVNCKNREFPPT